MYDMAHVLGLVGPHFQEPFAEGADLVTGSTHKTFFGTQRGVVAGSWRGGRTAFRLWESIETRAFPGSVSNHHLGTLLGLLMAPYEMNAFRDAYQPAGPRAMRRRLRGRSATSGMRVAGDPAVGFTETHQVMVKVGYGPGRDGPAARGEQHHLQLPGRARPTRDSPRPAPSTGASEMTRFGMGEEDFRQVAQFIRDVVVDDRKVADEVARFRSRFTDLRYCFAGPEFSDGLGELRDLI